MRAKLQPLFEPGRFVMNAEKRRPEFRREQIGWAHWCPGCNTFHAIKFDSGWKLSTPIELSIARPYRPEDDKPTFVHEKYRYIQWYDDKMLRAQALGHGVPVCVYRITAGQIVYTYVSPEIVPLPLWDLNDLLPKQRISWHVAARNWLRNLFSRKQQFSA